MGVMPRCCLTYLPKKDGLENPMRSHTCLMLAVEGLIPASQEV